MNLSRKILYILLGLIAATPIIWLLLWEFPKSQSNSYKESIYNEITQPLSSESKILLEKNAADIENSTRLTSAQIIAGLAFLAGLYLTYKNIRVTEEGKITERFSKAVEMLGSYNLKLRLGGIYALERIARDSQKDHWTVMEVLTGFVRVNAPYDPSEEKNAPYLPIEERAADDPNFEKKLNERLNIKVTEDIQAIMTVIGRRKWIKTETQRLNLNNVDLQHCVLEYVDLSRADLLGVNLRVARLKGANLSEASLSGANLNGARLTGANLNSTILTWTTLTFNSSLTLEQIIPAFGVKEAYLSDILRRQWEAYKAKERAGAGGDSSENQAEK